MLACRHDAMSTIIGGPDSDRPLHTEEAEETNEKEEGCIRIVQYNVGVFYKSGSSSLNMVADMMKELQADVISLNEVDSVTARTGRVDQIKAFASLMGNWNYRYAFAMPYNGGKYGIGVCASPELNYIRGHVVHLPKAGGGEDRALGVMEFDDFIVATTHIDLSTGAQSPQIDAINAFFNGVYQNETKPIFLCGDFNNKPGSETINEMIKTWKILTPQNPTAPAINPRSCIDYIFCRPGSANVQVVKTRICKQFDNGDVTIASDHLPVYVDIKLL